MEAKSEGNGRRYRRGVGLTLINRQGLVFAGQRLDAQSEAWQMPQGGIDPGETARQAALRELMEEVGTNKAEFVAEVADWLVYDLPLEIAGRVWRGGFRGQTQKWFALAFTGTDSDIDVATKHPEFKAWRWMPLESLVGLIVPFKRAVYERVATEFAPVAKRIAGG